jgi:integrase
LSELGKTTRQRDLRAIAYALTTWAMLAKEEEKRVQLPRPSWGWGAEEGWTGAGRSHLRRAYVENGKPGRRFGNKGTCANLDHGQRSASYKAWGVRFDQEPIWRDHWLDEPQERVRELHDDEAAPWRRQRTVPDRLDAETRDASGMRRRECQSLRWTEVDWTANQITKAGKGGRRVTLPITSEIREILWPLRGHHPEFVFTYQAQRTRDGRVQGKRYPLTLEGIKTAWR